MDSLSIFFTKDGGFKISSVSGGPWKVQNWLYSGHRPDYCKINWDLMQTA